MSEKFDDFQKKEAHRELYRERARKVAIQEKERRNKEVREKLERQITSAGERQRETLDAQDARLEKSISSTLLRDENKREQALAEAEIKNDTVEKVEELKQKGDTERLKLAAAFRAAEMKAEFQMQKRLSEDNHEMGKETIKNLRDYARGTTQYSL